MTETGAPTLEAFAQRMHVLGRTGARSLRGFAAWLADNPEELAFHSVRSLAAEAGTDANTVVRTMKAAGYSGFAAARREVQQALRLGDQGYVSRADALRRIGSDDLIHALSDAAEANTRGAFAPALLAEIDALVPRLLAARKVHCIGARMAYGLAHYFAYRGSITQANIAPVAGQQSLLRDSLAVVGPDDIVIVISFAHYSTEVVEAAAIARRRGATLVAITDHRDSPIAAEASQVLRAPMAGPHVMYSLVGAMLILETLLEMMAAKNPDAGTRLEAFEKGLTEVGAYTSW